MKQVFRVADLFCGAGGTSLGAMRAVAAMGAELDLVAINHWDTAIATHARNHPLARHYCINLDAANPAAIVEGGRLDLLLASPECTHFSRARGGKPVSDQRRASAYHVQRWVMALNGDIDRILIENVREFMEWGPLGPDFKIRTEDKGRYFFAWVNSLVEMGYDWDWRVVNAANFGDATTRERLFVQFVKKGLGGVQWPAPSHAKTVRAGAKPAGAMFGPSPVLKPWRAAREVIDLVDTGSSIFTRKKPLSRKTLHRIARGLVRFSGEAARPCLARMRPMLGFDAEVYIFRAVGPGKGGVFILGQQGGAVARSINDPLPVIATAGFIRKIHPMISSYYGSGSGQTCSSVDSPLPTVTTKARHALVVPYGPRAEARSVMEPMPTVMTKDRLALCTPFITPNFGERTGQSPRVHGVDDPLPAVTGHGAGALVSPIQEGDIHYRMLNNRELARAMGFDDAESEYEFTGTATEVTRQIGNAVPVHLAAALVTAMLAPVLTGEAAA
jgi:DNA (cytosine-5)-methyltransferase 1